MGQGGIDADPDRIRRPGPRDDRDSPAPAEPAGHYTIEGRDPSGNGAYSGTVEATRTGDTYKVVWEVAGETYVGTAIGNDRFLAVSYRSGDNTGLALYAGRGAGWDGVWTYAGGRKVGTETWTRE